MPDGLEIGRRYRDTRTGHHLLCLHGPADDLGWGYTVIAEPDGTLSDDIGAERWTADTDSYDELDVEPSTVVAELRNVVGKLFDEIDPTADGEWDSDRLPTLALAAVTLFQLVDDHLQQGGMLPLEWNPYVSAQPCKTQTAGNYVHDGGCRCMVVHCDGRHRCACGHTWQTPESTRYVLPSRSQ